MTGVPPTADEVLRLAGFYALTVVYVAFWLALALVASIVFRQAANRLPAEQALLHTLISGQWPGE